MGKHTPSDYFRSEKLFVGGEWASPIDGDIVESIDPSTGQPWARVAMGGRKDTDRAVEMAKDALRGPWSRWSPTERANLLRRIASVYGEHIDRLAELESRDSGMAIRDMRIAFKTHASWYNYAASLAEVNNGKAIGADRDVHVYTSKVPVGVVAAIMPWNYPLGNIAWKLAPALAAGCTMIIKPAEQTSATSFELAKILEQAGVPKGVVSILSGDGQVVGARLAEHPNVNKISFTGSHFTAQEIMRAGAANLKRLTFECGGKSAHIIFDDANLEAALNAAVYNSFVHCGQSCALGSRLLVHESVYQKVVDTMRERAGRVAVGSALDPTSDIGPQAYREQLDKTLSYIDIGKSEGARLVAGGTQPLVPGHADGYYVSPTVFADVDPKSRLAQEEVFGPVLSIIPFKTEEQAVEIANSTQYGLVSGLWTQDVTRAHRVARQIEAGTVWVNTYRYIRWSFPYGGFKMSGIGRENGPDALDYYQETRSTVVNLSGQYTGGF